MQQNVLNHENPFEKYFEEISRIPHGSGNEKALSDYLVSFAELHNLENYQDQDYCVLIRKPASKRYETAPTVILQSHMDMVCVKDSASTHNFLTDPLELILEDHILHANHTTLGADDGVGVAATLAILADNTLSHPALEAVFTTNEEVGMIGASHFDYSLLKGTRLIGLDAGGENETYLSTCGGLNIHLNRSYLLEEGCGKSYTLSVSGLSGGHSGMMINEGRNNAIKLCTQLLTILSQNKLNIRIAKFNGGLLSNAIPSECTVSFEVPSDQSDQLEQQFSRLYSTRYPAIQEKDPNCKITLTTSENIQPVVLSEEDSVQLLAVLTNLPHGVAHLDKDNPSYILASDNLASIHFEKSSIDILLSVRGSNDSYIDEIKQTIQNCSQNAFFHCSCSDYYPAWSYNPNSELREIAADLMKKEWNQDMVLEHAHGGIECGYFAKNIPGIDIFCIGPNAYDVHTENEWLDMNSVHKVFPFLVKLLANLH